MFEEIYKASYGDHYYLEFTCSASILFDDYQRFMELVWGSNREIVRIHLSEEATNPYDRSILPEYENTTPEQFKNLPPDAIIGAARTMGIELMQNFRQPYLATSVTDFWRRWHISLSGWFRDYLYFPLGGSQKSTFRTCVNLGIVFLVSGLWHGAEYTFVVWGMLHGLYMILERLTEKSKRRLYAALRIDRDGAVMTLLRRIFTFALVCVGWVFFRANYLAQAIEIFQKIGTASLVPNAEGMLAMLDVYDWLALLVALGLLLFVSLYETKRRSVLDAVEGLPRAVRWAIYYALAFAVILFGIYGPAYDAAAFIYFQF